MAARRYDIRLSPTALNVRHALKETTAVSGFPPKFARSLPFACSGQTYPIK
jgi:hypothetical protein